MLNSKPAQHLACGAAELGENPAMAERDGEERIAKLLARQGTCSRREAERLVIAGEVEVAGEIIRDPGRRVPVGSVITIRGKGEATLAHRVTILLNKPRGLVSTQPEGDQIPAWTLLTPGRCIDPDAEGVNDAVSQPWTCAVCGRLDQDSRGLLVLSQDGALARLITGGRAWAKRYRVMVHVDPDDGQMAAIRRLRRLDHEPIKAMQVERLGEKCLQFILREGRKHHIRRACALVGLDVEDLLRESVGPWDLTGLKEGMWRVVQREEVQSLIAAV